MFTQLPKNTWVLVEIAMKQDFQTAFQFIFMGDLSAKVTFYIQKLYSTW